MAPKTVAKPAAPVPVPEPEPEPEPVEVVDLTGDDTEDEDPEDDLNDLEEDLSSLGEHYDPMQQLTQLFVTEAGTPIVDVLQGIQDALEKQTKVMFKLVSVLDAKLPKS
jgi:hypothetical protein